MTPRSFLAVLALFCMALSSCSSAPLEPVTTADVYRRCGDLRFEGPVDEDVKLNPIPDDVKQILDIEIERIRAEAVGTDVVQWFLVSRSEDEIGIAHKRPNGDEDSYTEGHLNLTEDGWRGGGWGPCEIRLGVDDRQVLTWDLQTDSAPPGQVFDVLTVENNCASEPDLEDEDIQRLVVSTSERVTLLLVAPRNTSDQFSCRTREPQLIQVDLGEALGERELHDGGTHQIGSQRYPVE